MRQYETYRCNKCGNEVEVQNVGGGTLVCCGEEMEMITEDLTAVNLMKAFAGESQARNKYEFFAEVRIQRGCTALQDFFKKQQTMKNTMHRRNLKRITNLFMISNSTPHRKIFNMRLTVRDMNMKRCIPISLK